MGRSAPRREVDAADVPVHLGVLHDGELDSGGAIEAMRVDGSLVVAPSIFGAVITECVLEGVDLRGSRLLGLRCSDVRFEGCDLAGAVLQDAVLTRVEFVRCRMTGTQLSGCELQDVQVIDCAGDMLALRMAKANYLWISRGSLREADFYQAELAASRITDCDLTAADFSRANVPDLDLRGSVLEALLGASSLRGAVITSEQLLALAGALANEAGITVAD